MIIQEKLENYQEQQQTHQQQAYDSTLKSLFQDQTLEMISIFVDDIENPVELNETALRPSLRVDRAYMVQRKGKQRIVHQGVIMNLDEITWIRGRDRFITSVWPYHVCSHGRDKSVPTSYPNYLVNLHN